MTKKRMLFAWGNAYTFDGLIVPVIPQLARDFDLFILLVDFFMPPGLTDRLKAWAARGLIRGYAVVPEYNDTLRLHMFMRSNLKSLRELDVDILLSSSTMQVFERYVLECVLGDRCLRVCYWPSATFLLTREALAKKLVQGDRIDDLVEDEMARSRRQAPALRLRMNETGLTLHRLASLVKSRIIASCRRLRSQGRWFADRYLLPALLVGKTFPLAKYDWLTQLGTDQFDAIMFADELDAAAFAALYRSPNMYVVPHPAQGSCRCGSSQERTTILSCLTGYDNSDDVPETFLALYHRDLQIVHTETGATAVHLRPHPRAVGRWPHRLAEYLQRRGMKALIVGSDRPVRQVVCDYLGVAGIVSSSLRDARASCNYALVVGFVGVSKTLFSDPKLFLGKGDGIDWIDEDGSHEVLRRRPYSAEPRASLNDVLSAMSRPELTKRLEAHRAELPTL